MCKQNLTNLDTFRRNLDKMSYSTKCPLDEIGLDEMPWIPSRETCLQKCKNRFSRVMVDVYPLGGTFKHIAEWGKSKTRVIIRKGQHMEVWFFYLLSYNWL